jgi:glutamine phosphoribosylpyrophosphate amidotransferase
LNKDQGKREISTIAEKSGSNKVHVKIYAGSITRKFFGIRPAQTIELVKFGMTSMNWKKKLKHLAKECSHKNNQYVALNVYVSVFR